MYRILVTVIAVLAMFVASSALARPVGFSTEIGAIAGQDACPVWPCGD
jgi:hypothetical protein